MPFPGLQPPALLDRIQDGLVIQQQTMMESKTEIITITRFEKKKSSKKLHEAECRAHAESVGDTAMFTLVTWISFC